MLGILLVILVFEYSFIILKLSNSIILYLYIKIELLKFALTGNIIALYIYLI